MSGLTRRELLKAAGIAGAAAALPAAPVGAQGTQKRELVVAQGGDISKFDPHYSTSSNDIRISFNLFDNLVSRHPDGKLYPSLATEWKLTNPTTWTFKLRQGVKWHNGDPFSSADVKYSFERTWDPKLNTRVSTVFTTVEKVDAPDANTVVFTTKKPDPLLDARVAFYGGQIVMTRARREEDDATILAGAGLGEAEQIAVEASRRGEIADEERDVTERANFHRAWCLRRARSVPLLGHG